MRRDLIKLVGFETFFWIPKIFSDWSFSAPVGRHHEKRFIEQGSLFSTKVTMETKQEPTSLHLLIQCSLKTRVWNEHNVGGTEGSNKECN